MGSESVWKSELHHDTEAKENRTTSEVLEKQNKTKQNNKTKRVIKALR